MKKDLIPEEKSVAILDEGCYNVLITNEGKIIENNLFFRKESAVSRFFNLLVEFSSSTLGMDDLQKFIKLGLFENGKTKIYFSEPKINK